MPLKNKTMALIRLRKTPYSGLSSFMSDVFYKQEELSVKSIELLKIIYSKELKSTEWRSVIKKLFNVNQPTINDEQLVEEALSNYLSIHKEDLKSRHGIRKAYNELMSKELSKEVRDSLIRINKWNSAITSYYSIINKLKALGLIDKRDGYYVRSDKFKNRLNQVITLLDGFEDETKQN